MICVSTLSCETRNECTSSEEGTKRTYRVMNGDYIIEVLHRQLYERIIQNESQIQNVQKFTDTFIVVGVKHPWDHTPEGINPKNLSMPFDFNCVTQQSCICHQLPRLFVRLVTFWTVKTFQVLVVRIHKVSCIFLLLIKFQQLIIILGKSHEAMKGMNSPSSRTSTT